MYSEPSSTLSTGLLLLIQRLRASGRPLLQETLLPFAELKLPEVAQNYLALVDELRQRQFIEGTEQAFSLTPAGEKAVQEAAARHSLHAWFYNAFYQAVQRSPAHARFCERVYGLDLAQHGMADMLQLDALMQELHIQPGMSLLDFGCGDGRIAEYFSDHYNLVVSGVDIAEQALKLAHERTHDKRSRLRFYYADVERELGNFPGQTFERISAIDSLFFCQDQRKVLEKLLSHLKPGGRMGVFYHCSERLAAEETILAQALQTLNMGYYTLDFTEQNAAHWAKKKQVLLEMEADFRAEGSDFLFKNRLAECSGLEHNHRYLFVIQQQGGSHG